VTKDYVHQDSVYETAWRLEGEKKIKEVYGSGFYGSFHRNKTNKQRHK